MRRGGDVAANRPCSPDGWRQDEHVEDLAQLIRVDVVANVGLRALAEELVVVGGD